MLQVLLVTSKQVDLESIREGCIHPWWRLALWLPEFLYVPFLNSTSNNWKACHSSLMQYLNNVLMMLHCYLGDFSQPRSR
jgi:hypothetical protein